MSRRIKHDLRNVPTLAQILASHAEGGIDDYAWFSPAGTPLVDIQLTIAGTLPDGLTDPMDWLHRAGYPVRSGISCSWTLPDRRVCWQPDRFHQVRFLVDHLGLTLSSEVRSIYETTRRVWSPEQIHGTRRDTSR